MPRKTRITDEQTDAWYHVYAKVAGKKGDFVLHDPLCQRRLIGLVRHYAGAYYCSLAAFCVMGNHYHLVLQMERRREVAEQELRARAEMLYSKETLQQWSSARWTRFEERLFDLSELMRNVQGTFARWYNDTFDRTGRFWGARFKSTLLEEGQSVLDCMVYVDLNPVRAGLVEQPETYESSSAFARHMGQDRWLANLEQLVGRKGGKAALTEYRIQLYHRGNVPTKAGQASIPDSVVAAVAASEYAPAGIYCQRLRFFVQGLVVGSEGFIRKQLTKVQNSGAYPSRKHPISHLGGAHHSLREQRSNARS